MKTKIQLFAALCMAILLFGCEKVIDIDVNDVNPQYVVEGTFSEGIQVAVSQTGDYFDATPPSNVTDATLTLTGSDGTNLLLESLGGGLYGDTGATAIPGVAYTLEVVTEAAAIHGISTAPAITPLDNVTAEFRTATPFTREGWGINVQFQDDPAVTNYYRILLTVNGQLRNEAGDYLLFDDELTNGNLVELSLRSQKFELGDVVEVELRSLDRATYDYYITLESLLGSGRGPSEAAPSNPDNNLSNGALGYFSAYTSDTLQVIIN